MLLLTGTITLLTLLGTVSAVPAVKAVPLANGRTPSCSWWPSWIPTRDADTTGSLIFTPSFGNEDSINGLPSQNYIQADGTEVLAIDLRKSRSIAKNYYRCSNEQAVVGASFKNITISKNSNNAQMLVGASLDKVGYGVELYAHEIDGVRQDGVFVGAKGKTTWGFRWIWEQGCGGKLYYEAKLLGLPVDPEFPPGAAYDPDFEGFLKVESY